MREKNIRNLIISTFFSLILFVMGNAAKAATPQELYARNLYFDSIEQLEKMLLNQPANSPESQSAKYILGLNYYRLGSLYNQLFLHAAFYEKTYYDLLSEDVPNISQNTRLMWYKGICHYSLREFDEAIELFDKVAMLDNDNLNIERARMWKKASIICKKGDLQSKEDWARLYAEVSPSLRAETLLLSCIEQKQIEHNNNIESNIAHNDFFARRSLINYYTVTNTLDKAQKLLADIDFDEPAETIPGEKESSIKLYDPFLLKTFSIMAYTQAKVYFEECISSKGNKKNMHPEYWLGRSYLELGQLSNSINILEKESEYLQASIYLGEAYWKKGDKSKAREIWRNFEKKAKKPDLLRDLALTYGSLKIDLDNAEILARKALQLKQKDDRRRRVLQPYYGCIGYILFQQKRIEDAVEEYGYGFFVDEKHTVEVNNPEYILQYSKTIFIPDVLSYDLINQSMLTLSKAYKGALQLRNAMSGIYLITFKNIERGKFRDGM